MIRHVLMIVGISLSLSLTAAQAHENRLVGAYALTVGFRAEDPQTFPGQP
jgi:hypothetical protein